MALQLTLHKSIANTQLMPDSRSTTRMQVTAVASNGQTDARVFLLLRGVPNPTTGDTYDEFHAVCSPVDMAYYPAGSPSNSTQFPFYRTDTITLDFRGRTNSGGAADYDMPGAEQTWLQIQAEVSALLQALAQLASLSLTQTLTVGPY